MAHGCEGMPRGPADGQRISVGRERMAARAALSAAREAVRLLDYLLGSAAHDPGGDAIAFSVAVSGRVLDRVTLWLASRPAPAPASACPVAAAQREAVELLMDLVARMEIIRPLPSGDIELRFAPGAILFDRLMLWGAVVEDIEILGEDDEDGADAEPLDHPPDAIRALDPGVPQEMASLVLDLYEAVPRSALEAPDQAAAA